MALSDVIESELARLGYGPLEEVTAVNGGSINKAYRLSVKGGAPLFVKTHPSPPAGFFEAEAQGLVAIAGAASIRVPAVISVGRDYLLLEWLEGKAQAHYWSGFGEQLATLHGHEAEEFGFSHDNYCGLTPQPNPSMADGYRFFSEARLLYQGRRALAAGLLDSADLDDIESICRHLPEWVPPQRPSLIHGDLWSGNAHCGPSGEPVLVDPASHYGWHEAELAMTTLFGGFPAAFYRAYEATSGCDPEWSSRAPIYNLYHLLNHLNLFGGAYLQAVRSILGRFARRK
jgi:fructosamine-3-kinase